MVAAGFPVFPHLSGCLWAARRTPRPEFYLAVQIGRELSGDSHLPDTQTKALATDIARSLLLLAQLGGFYSFSERTTTS